MPPYQSPFRMPDWQQALIDSLMNNSPAPSFGAGLSPAEQAMSAGANVRDLYMQALSEQPRINDELDQYLADEKANAAAEEEFNKKLFAANAAHRMDLETEAFKESIKPSKSVNKLGQEVEQSKNAAQIMATLQALVQERPTATASASYTGQIKGKKGYYNQKTGEWQAGPYVTAMPEEKVAPPGLKKPRTSIVPPANPAGNYINPKSIGGAALEELGSEAVGSKVMKGLNDVAQVHPLIKAASLTFSKDPSEITLDDIAKLIKSFSPIGATMELQKVWNKAVAPNYFK